MNCKIQRHVAKTRIVYFLAALIMQATLTGCASIDHAREYRDARTIYNTATEQANSISTRHMLPNLHSDTTKTVDSYSIDSRMFLTTGYSVNDYQKLYDQYTESTKLFTAINTNSQTRSGLINDKLYGSSVALGLLAQWKSIYYARLLAIEDPKANPAPKNSTQNDLLPETASWADLRLRHDRVMQELETAKAAVYPRDQFLLKAFEPLLRYDNAYLYLVEWNAKGMLAKAVTPDIKDRFSNVHKIVEEIAQAEKELAEVVEETKVEPHIKNASILVRLMMLRTAVAVVNNSKVTGNSWKYADAKMKLPLLTDRVENFAIQSITKSASEYRLFSQLEQLPPTRKYDFTGVYWARQ